MACGVGCSISSETGEYFSINLIIKILVSNSISRIPLLHREASATTFANNLKTKADSMLQPILGFCSLAFFLWLTPGLNAAAESPTTVESYQSLDKVYFIGHLNPDSDAIFGAIGAAYLFDGIAARVGALNSESAYILQRFGLPEPVLVENTPDKKYFLIDFNQKTQLLAGVQDQQIVGIIDHHAVQSSYVGPAEPIDLTIKAWGSSCTIITDLFLHRKLPIPEAIAGGLLGGIISDTLNLTSPTTTEADRKAVAHLKTLAGVRDVNAFARELFNAKSRTSHLSAMEILQQDYKEFDLEGVRFGMGVVETVFPEEVLARQEEILEAIRALKAQTKLPFIMFAVVQPETKESVLLLSDKIEEDLARSVFGGAIGNHKLVTTPRVSRKLQFIPAMKKFFVESSERSAEILSAAEAGSR
jgi:manganese-dependent inorganic pyrophosphatase